MIPTQNSATGRQIAARMQDVFPDSDWIGEMAALAAEERDMVERHLQDDMVPPPQITDAAAQLLNAAGESWAPAPSR